MRHRFTQRRSPLRVMTPLHFRRSALLRRLLLLALLAFAALVAFLWISPKFLPDEPLDASLRRTIRVEFKLPVDSAANDMTKKRTVPRVHFMHRSHLILTDYKPYMSSWRRVYPSYELYFWTDADIDRLIAKRYPQLGSFYRGQLSNPLERSDFARALILHSFGGWYSDLDGGCQASAENLTDAHALIVPLEPYAHAMVSFKRRRLVNNAIMYSAAKHIFWMFYLHTIATVVKELPSGRTKDDAVFSTGPVTMTRAMDQFTRAHADRCGAGTLLDYWCPHVPGPRQFSPLIDTSSHWLATWARLMCLAVLNEPEITGECRRLRRDNFVGVVPPDAFTYHGFLHLTGTGLTSDLANVSSWGLDIRLNPMAHLG